MVSFLYICSMRRFLRFLMMLLAMVVVAARPAMAQSDSTSVAATMLDKPMAESHFYRFKPNQVIAPAALLAVGVTGVYAFDGFKKSVQRRFNGRQCGHGTSVDDYIQYLPAAVYLPLGFIPGVKHRSDFRERLMAGLTAYAVMTVVNNVMKVSFREPRPDSGARNSFPSGHSATAFTGAELMRIEYGNVVGLTGYAAAIAVGALRIYNDRHWINDVFGGAAIGILSARIGYWLVPWERKLFGLDKKKKAAGGDDVSVAVVPAGAGIAMAITF